MKRYDKQATLCDYLKHQRPPCTGYMPDPDPAIAYRDVYKRSRHGDGAILSEVSSEPQVAIRYMDVPQPCGSKPFPMTQVNIKRTYPEADPCICTFEPVRLTDQNSSPDKKYNSLVAASYTTDRVDKPVLVVGPERCDVGRVTNLWNNNTSRKMISDTLEHHY